MQQQPQQADPIEVILDKKLFNETYLPYVDDNTPTQIFFGGSSAGKSQFVIGQRTIRDLMKGGRNFLVVRKVGRTLDTSVFNQCKQGINNFKVKHLFHVTSSPMRITCKVNAYIQKKLKKIADKANWSVEKVLEGYKKLVEYSAEEIFAEDGTWHSLTFH